MRHIYVDNDFRLRFPGRCETFDQGVEIGLLIATMDTKVAQFSRCISSENRDQAEALATALGYHALTGHVHERWTVMTFKLGAKRPKLRLVI